MRQFNTLAQYGTYHVDMDEKKANLYRAGLTIHLQECLVHLFSLSYNELVSAAIDQERIMKAIAEADEKKRKRKMPGGQLRRPQQQQNWGHHPQFQPQQF
jgi:hypothetical protein